MVLIVFLAIFFQSSLQAQDVEKLPTLLTQRSSVVPNITPEQKANLYEFVRTDPFKLIHPDFKIPDYFDEATQFWFRIYTEFTSDNVIIHSRDRHSIILSVLDVTGLVDGHGLRKLRRKENELPKFSKNSQQTQRIVLPKTNVKAYWPQLSALNTYCRKKKLIARLSTNN